MNPQKHKDMRTAAPCHPNCQAWSGAIPSPSEQLAAPGTVPTTRAPPQGIVGFGGWARLLYLAAAAAARRLRARVLASSAWQWVLQVCLVAGMLEGVVSSAEVWLGAPL